MRANLAYRVRARQYRDIFRVFRKNVGRITSPSVAIFLLVCLLARSSWKQQEITRKIAEITQEGEDVGAKEGAHLLDLEDTGTRYESSLADSLGNSLALQTKDIVMKTAAAPDRRLGLYAGVKDYASASATSGCATVSLKANPVSLLLSGRPCGGNVCPSCWICTSGSDANELKLTGCSDMSVSNSKRVGAGDPSAPNSAGDPMITAMVGFVFINADNFTKFKVSDGNFTNEIAPGAAAVAYCYTSGSNKFFWPNP